MRKLIKTEYLAESFFFMIWACITSDINYLWLHYYLDIPDFSSVTSFLNAFIIKTILPQVSVFFMTTQISLWYVIILTVNDCRILNKGSIKAKQASCNRGNSQAFGHHPCVTSILLHNLPIVIWLRTRWCYSYHQLHIEFEWEFNVWALAWSSLKHFRTSKLLFLMDSWKSCEKQSENR